jgi:hypothetical protein
VEAPPKKQSGLLGAPQGETRIAQTRADFQPKLLRGEDAMASGDRFYQLDLRHRPALMGDVGSLLKIEGLVVGGEGAQTVLLLPDVAYMDALLGSASVMMTPVRRLTVEQWTDWLQRSDNPEILVQGSLEKVFHRKVRYEISGAVQQKVWVADGCKCMYCFRSMGAVPLTVDHFVPLEMGGANDSSNYLSACRKCNKDKGGMAPADWIAYKKPVWPPHTLTVEWYVQYLAHRTLP